MHRLTAASVLRPHQTKNGPLSDDEVDTIYDNSAYSYRGASDDLSDNESSTDTVRCRQADQILPNKTNWDEPLDSRMVTSLSNRPSECRFFRTSPPRDHNGLTIVSGGNENQQPNFSAAPFTTHWTTEERRRVSFVLLPTTDTLFHQAAVEEPEFVGGELNDEKDDEDKRKVQMHTKEEDCGFIRLVEAHTVGSAHRYVWPLQFAPCDSGFGHYPTERYVPPARRLSCPSTSPLAEDIHCELVKPRVKDDPLSP